MYLFIRIILSCCVMCKVMCKSEVWHPSIDLPKSRLEQSLSKMKACKIINWYFVIMEMVRHLNCLKNLHYTQNKGRCRSICHYLCCTTEILTSNKQSSEISSTACTFVIGWEIYGNMFLIDFVDVYSTTLITPHTLSQCLAFCRFRVSDVALHSSCLNS